MKQFNRKPNKNDDFEKILAKENPKLFLKLKKREIEPQVYPRFGISEPLKLLFFLAIVDFIAAFLLTVITHKSHFIIGSPPGIWLLIPWWLALLDGIILIGYGIYVIKRKRGELDVAQVHGARSRVYEIKGDAASVLGIVYILLGVLLLGAVIIQCFIKGIF